MTLPGFSLMDYRRMLRRFNSAGYKIEPVGRMVFDYGHKAVYLRHDVDFNPKMAFEMAKEESRENCRSTYYFLLAGRYNLFEKENRKILRAFVELGHEIGLHYDLVGYPSTNKKRQKQLDFEVRVLSEISGFCVQTICMHQPSTGDFDYFKQSSRYLNPHCQKFAKDLVYVSDSCRAWRDEKLLGFYRPNGPRRLLLNTHPESWLNGKIKQRLEYLEAVLFQREVLEDKIYYLDNVRKIWLSHPGAKAHDSRQLQKIKK